MKRDLINRLKATFPRGAAVYRQIRQVVSEVRPITNVFTGIYTQNVWENDESVSGPGSSLAETSVVRERLPGLLSELGATSLLDVPCGDFNWMRHVSLPLEMYIGGDILAELTDRNNRLYGGSSRRFIKVDITFDPLPDVDVILCRDCLVHLSYRKVLATLHNMKSGGSKYLLTTHYPFESANINIVTGGWRPLNLELAPFGFPTPAALIDEKIVNKDGQKTGKHLALWKLDDLHPA